MISEKFSGLLLFIGVIGVIALLLFLGLAATSLSEVSRLAQPRSVEVFHPTLPAVRDVKSPVVILALDVSASMKRNDPSGQQARAVHSFLRMYHALVMDALDRNDIARVGVVLFGSGAETFRWPIVQGGEVLLPLPPSHDDFDQLITRHLLPMIEPRNGIDPRNSPFTDYMAALREIEQLVNRLTNCSPPLVLFLSDGEDDPFWPAAIQSPDERRVVLQQLYQEMLESIQNDYIDQPEKIQKIKLAFNELMRMTKPSADPNEEKKAFYDVPRKLYDLLGRELFPYVQQALRSHTRAPDVAATRKEEIRNILKNFSSRMFSSDRGEEGMPLMFQLIYLGKNQRPLDFLSGLRQQIADIAHFWQLPDEGVHQCENADQLLGSFINTLARWLDIPRINLEAGTTSFVVGPETQGLAAMVRSSSNVKSLSLLDIMGNQYPFHEISRHAFTDWVLTLSRPTCGEWRISSSEPTQSATIWMRQRYAWAFDGIPKHLSPFHSNTIIKVALFDIKTRAPVNPNLIYQPESLPLTLNFTAIHDGTQAITIPFHALKDAQENILYYYQNIVRLTDLTGRRIELNGTIEGLKYKNSMTRSMPQTLRLVLEKPEAVYWQLQNYEGVPLEDIAFDKVVPGSGVHLNTTP